MSLKCADTERMTQVKHQHLYAAFRDVARTSPLFKIGIVTTLPGMKGDTSVLAAVADRGHKLPFERLTTAHYYPDLVKYLRAATVGRIADRKSFRFHRHAKILGQTIKEGTGICAKLPFIQHGDPSRVEQHTKFFGTVRGFLTLRCIARPATALAAAGAAAGPFYDAPTGHGDKMTVVVADWYRFKPGTALGGTLLLNEFFQGDSSGHIIFLSDIVGLAAFTPISAADKKHLQVIDIPFVCLF